MMARNKRNHIEETVHSVIKVIAPGISPIGIIKPDP
jgi:hypothetical protein